MKIRKLEASGFKSFVDPVVLHFGPGISGVVGPNGCGKSNIVDAVKWCIGEQSARSLRGESMADVIFAGSSTRSPTQFAEVSLTFVPGEDTPFPGVWSRYSELQVTRRLHRDGGSEYLINREKVRLRDIQDLFMDTGIGNQLYSFIEQGRIGQIVQARPEQRRALIEEAAGITRFKARREETESRLDAVKQSLSAVAERAEERARQVKPCERQLQKVLRYRALQAKARQEEVVVGLASYAQGIYARKRLTEDLRDARRQAELEERALARHEEQQASKRARLEQEEEQASATRAALAEVEAQRRVEESAAIFQDREAVEGAQRRVRLEEEAAERTQEAAVARSQAEEERERLGEVEELLAEKRLALESLQEEGQSLDVAVLQRRSARDAAQREAQAAFTLTVRHKAGQATFASRRADIDARSARQAAQLGELRAAQEKLQEELTEQAERRETLLAAAEKADERVAEIRRSLSGQEQAVQAAAAQEKQAEALVTGVAREEARVRGHLEALQDREERHLDVPDGVRQALKHPSAVGLLSQELSVPEALEPVVARALDGALEAVVVPDAASAVAIAAGAKGARVRVWVSALGVPQGSAAQAGSLAAQIGGSDAGRAAAAALLGGAKVAPSVEAAYAAFQPGQRIVTPDGALLREDGLLVLGGDKEAEAGKASLQRRREIAALVEQHRGVEERLASAREAQAAALQRRMEAEQAVAAGRAALAEASNQARAFLPQIAELDQKKKLQEGELSRIKKAQELLHKEARVIEEARGALQAEEATVEGAIAKAEAEQARWEAVVRQAAGELEPLEPRAAQVSALVASARLAVVQLDAQSKAHRAALQAADEQERRASKRLEVVQREAAELIARLGSLGSQVEATRAKLAALVAQQAQLAAQAEREREAIAAGREALKGEEQALRSVRERREKAKEVVVRLESSLSEVRGSIERILTDAQERGHASLATLLERLERDGQLLLPGYAPGELPDGIHGEEVIVRKLTMEDLGEEAGVDARKRLTTFRESLERMGGVNLAAEEEYREIAARYAELLQQKGDLELALDTIARAVARINKECRERFEETFNRVQAAFARLYSRMVGGGQARLSLTTPEDLLATGVDVQVQPPGKRVQSISLLSGGEKALAAIALIFALFEVKPSPFCMLDEVDAPLDEANGARFNELLKEMSQISQFIVVTHSKKTMEVADTLYGITMPEPGASRLVTVRIE